MLVFANRHLRFTRLTRAILCAVCAIYGVFYNLTCQRGDESDGVFALPEYRLFINAVVIRQRTHQPKRPVVFHVLPTSQDTDIAKNLSNRCAVIHIAGFLLDNSSCLLRLSSNRLIVDQNIRPDKGIEHFLKTILAVCPKLIILKPAVEKRACHSIPAFGFF